jgi:hypothetical protein
VRRLVTSDGRSVGWNGRPIVVPDEWLGVRESAGPGVSVQEAAASVVDRLASAHEVELTQGEADLRDALSGRLGPAALHDPRVVEAVDWVLHADRGHHTAARSVVERELSEAFSAPMSERERRVFEVLAAERQRIRGRARTRVARALRPLAARLVDGGGSGPAVAEVPADRLAESAPRDLPMNILDVPVHRIVGVAPPWSR